MPWREAVDYAVGARTDYLRDVVLLIAVPLLVVRARTGFFLFFYLCAVWLFCLNPLLARMWMANILAPTYFRLVYLLTTALVMHVDRQCRFATGAERQGYAMPEHKPCWRCRRSLSRSLAATTDFQSYPETQSWVSVGSPP